MRKKEYEGKLHKISVQNSNEENKESTHVAYKYTHSHA